MLFSKINGVYDKICDLCFASVLDLFEFVISGIDKILHQGRCQVWEHAQCKDVDQQELGVDRPDISLFDLPFDLAVKIARIRHLEIDNEFFCEIRTGSYLGDEPQGQELVIVDEPDILIGKMPQFFENGHVGIHDVLQLWGYSSIEFKKHIQK